MRPHVYVRGWALGCFYSHNSQYPNLSEGADHVGGQLRGDKECAFSGVTKSGRVWRKVPESDARSVPHTATPPPAPPPPPSPPPQTDSTSFVMPHDQRPRSESDDVISLVGWLADVTLTTLVRNFIGVVRFSHSCRLKGKSPAPLHHPSPHPPSTTTSPPCQHLPPPPYPFRLLPSGGIQL